MRETKFRAWDLNNKKMWTDFKCYLLLDIAGNRIFHTVEDHYLPLPGNYELMQYTGLKAKNGEIYEGDIIRMNAQGRYTGTFYGEPGEEYDIDYTGEVVILPSKGVCLKNPLCIDGINGNKGKVSGYKEVRAYRSEIIGNIYENPELLETTMTK